MGLITEKDSILESGTTNISRIEDNEKASNYLSKVRLSTQEEPQNNQSSEDCITIDINGCSTLDATKEFTDIEEGETITNANGETLFYKGVTKKLQPMFEREEDEETTRKSD
jgi:hypothetical protein